MNFKTFLKENNLTKANCLVCCSKRNTYTTTNQKIVFVKLDKTIDNQDYLVLSANAAKAITSNTTKMYELEASYDENFGWGLTLPPSYEEVSVKW